MAAPNQNKNASAQPASEPGLIGRSLTAMVQILMLAFATLLFAIVIEWVGMSFFWETEGSRHSAAMLETELHYLNSDFKRSTLVREPLQFAQRFADNFYYYGFQKTGIERGLKWLATTEPQQNKHLHAFVQSAYRLTADYILAAINMTSVFAVRLAVLALSAPAFILLVLVGMIDGLVQRDIRRWSGGRESAFIYHWAKKFILPSLMLPWMLYLAMPISIHPTLIVLPFAVLFALAMTVMTSTFKKYL